MRDIWFVSDRHLFHGGETGEGGILKFRDDAGNLIRPGFDNIQQMHDAILEGHNSVVKPGDIVYDLGDVVMLNTQAKVGFPSIFPKFNGSHRIIFGNHDDPKWLAAGGFYKKMSTWRVFKEFGIILSHIPLHQSSLKEDENGESFLCVHGHIHQNLPPKGPYVNLSLEQLTGYKPVHIDAVRDLWKEQQQKVVQRESFSLTLGENSVTSFS